jgi:hypothetical protein
MQALYQRTTSLVASGWDFLTEPNYYCVSRPLLAFAITRLIALVGGYISAAFIPEDTSIQVWHGAPGSPFFDMWGRWDSAWYLQITNGGYFFTPGKQSAVAFFPLYPLLMSLLKPFTNSALLAGWLISNVCFLLALILLYKLVEREFSDSSIAARAVLYIAIFPTAFFFSAVYSESLFLLLAAASFYFVRQRKWLYAAMSGMFLAATRIVGVTMWLVIIVEWLHVHGLQLRTMPPKEMGRNFLDALHKDWCSLAAIQLIPFGLAAYMLYLQAAFGNPLAFMIAQKDWDNQVRGALMVIWTTVRDLLAGAHFWWFAPLDLAVFFAALAICWAVWRRLGSTYGLYSLLCILIPISSTTRSMIRYALVAFPLFIILAWWGRNPRFNRAYVGISAVFLAVFMAIFVSWRFIA